MFVKTTRFEQVCQLLLSLIVASYHVRKQLAESLVDGKCPNLSVWLCLRTRGKLMLANFRLKSRPF